MLRQWSRTMIMVFLALLIFGSSSVSATGTDGFMDIPWGTSRGDVAKKMAELSYPKDTDSNAERDVYDGMFAGRKAFLSFFYINNLFYKSNVYFIDTYHSPQEGDFRALIDAYFKDFENQLISKYGKPAFVFNGVDNWTAEDQGTRISIMLGHAYGEPRFGVYSGVTITYTNTTFYEKEKQHTMNRDL